ncbi:class Ia ribonucleoside-diphosphate reductase subunit beta [Buchnera aphidicola]|uniref:Ribonucleoside-diphosphate reductase subunit beta n=1 Tax=Buchnera aphidicola (Stegophylla sp.) TaxID=2315800 RepID=A0A4D6YIT5_9GAMM|nr:ribonucleotide-diphosphate reductase subunit beta [Buchnera aphidicola (Stegophylla sp.)]QCI26311.1 ribonucleotide-diphosphate reductase subunit beta [Buchnera aphidicola (Stegophylla sp.)]
MLYTTFSKINNNQLQEPMFFGQSVNIARYDQQKYKIFEQLIEKQLSFFWRPEEIDLSKDRIDFKKLKKHEKHIFISNLQYQTLLDSIQGRSPNIAFLPIISIPELETWIETWSFSETIHSRSYTHIIRNIVNNPAIIFDNIISNKNICNRAKDISHYYDLLITITEYWHLFGSGTYQVKKNKNIEVNIKTLKKALYLCLININVLEAIRFYVSFACSFAFAECALMEGNAKIIRLIARDESLHLTGTQHIINILKNYENDPMMKKIINESHNESIHLFKQAAQQEKKWAEYLFQNGSMLGLNKNILWKYIEYITNIRMQAINLPHIFPKQSNPIPWINNWLISDHVQTAPQEIENSSYLTGQIDSKIKNHEFKNFKL